MLEKRTVVNLFRVNDGFFLPDEHAYNVMRLGNCQKQSPGIGWASV